MVDPEKKIFSVVPKGFRVGPIRIPFPGHKIGEPVNPTGDYRADIVLKESHILGEPQSVVTIAKVVSRNALVMIEAGEFFCTEPITLKGQKINDHPLVNRRLHYGLPTDALPPTSLLERFISRFQRN